MIARHPDRPRQLSASFVARFPSKEASLSRTPHATSSSYCTADNPDEPIQDLFWDPINSGQIAGNDKSLVAAIKARGTKAGKEPKIIFTTYYQPRPDHSQSNECLDIGDISRAESDYLITLENTLKATLIAAMSELNGVSVADTSSVVARHEYCTSDLWTYGLSVLVPNDASLAPVHPIPKAQAAIAAALKKNFPDR